MPVIFPASAIGRFRKTTGEGSELVAIPALNARALFRRHTQQAIFVSSQNINL